MEAVAAGPSRAHGPAAAPFGVAQGWPPALLTAPAGHI